MQNARLIFRLYTMRREQGGNGNFFIVIGVCENHVLVCRQAEFDFRKFFRDIAQCDFFRVFHATAFDE